MRLGLQIPSFTWPGGPTALGTDLLDSVRVADDVGFDMIAVMDHFWQIRAVGPETQDMLEAYTTLGYIAAATRRAKLLTLVTGVHYRQPGLLAKTITTLDVLSGGRAILGIGAGWNEDESRGLGFPFPPLGERFEILEETIRFVQEMWAGGAPPFHSPHIDADRLLNVPAPLSRPHPPILIGGGGERKTLRLVARYAQYWNGFPGPDLAHKLEVLREHCDREGTDYDAIEKTCYYLYDLGPNGEKVEDSIEQLRRLHALGFSVVIGGVAGGHPSPRILERIGRDLVPVAAAL